MSRDRDRRDPTNLFSGMYKEFVVNKTAVIFHYECARSNKKITTSLVNRLVMADNNVTSKSFLSVYFVEKFLSELIFSDFDMFSKIIGF
jgi:hypothetical protein